MNITKMSLITALLIGSSAFAIDNIKTSGDAKLYYTTSDEGTNVDLFSKESAAAQAAVSLSLSADLTEGISAGAKLTALSTLGLEGQLVNNVWEGTNGTSDSFITNELWLAGTVGKTTGKIGRMELDTPLVFSEKWSIVANTFEAAVVINQDIPNTTLVGAFVGGSNSSHNSTGNGTHAAGIANVIDTSASGTTFSQFFKGAYAAGVVNNSWEPLTVQAWYYNATSQAKAYWLQADLNMEGILLGAQFTGLDAAGLGVAESNTAFAVMAGYEMKDTVTAKIAYSAVSDDAGIGAGFNLSGSDIKNGHGSKSQSKLYTEAWWNYGQVAQLDTTTINVTVESPVNGIVDLGLYATLVDHGDKNTVGNMTEVTVTAGKTFGPLDTTLAVIYADADAADTTAAIDPDAITTIQAYLTYNF